MNYDFENIKLVRYGHYPSSSITSSIKIDFVLLFCIESTVRSSSIKSFSSQVVIKVFNSSRLICCSCTLFSVSASSSSISVKKIGSGLFRTKSGFDSVSSRLSSEGIFDSVSRISMLPS